MTKKGTAIDQTWAFALGRGKVGQKNSDRLTDELAAAVGSDFLSWQEKEERLAQKRPQVFEGIAIPKDVTSFIFDHLLPQLMDGKRSKERPKKHKILDLVLALEPDQFVGLVLLYAHRIGNRDGVSRAFNILTTSSNFYRKRLKAHRDSYKGGRQKEVGAKAGLRERNQKILKRRSDLLKMGKPEHNIASMLEREFDLSATHIRKIIKNTKA